MIFLSKIDEAGISQAFAITIVICSLSSEGLSTRTKIFRQKLFALMQQNVNLNKSILFATQSLYLNMNVRFSFNAT